MTQYKRFVSVSQDRPKPNTVIVIEAKFRGMSFTQCAPGFVLQHQDRTGNDEVTSTFMKLATADEPPTYTFFHDGELVSSRRSSAQIVPEPAPLQEMKVSEVLVGDEAMIDINDKSAWVRVTAIEPGPSESTRKLSYTNGYSEGMVIAGLESTMLVNRPI